MKKSFTLIEILVVVTIIVLLTAAAVVSYSVFLKQSRDARRKVDLEQLRAALEIYRSDNNSAYPAGDVYGTALSELVVPITYIQKLPADPKDPTYTYFYSGSVSDYTLAAYLENGGTTCITSPTCGSYGCNYCLGPYGEK